MNELPDTYISLIPCRHLFSDCNHAQTLTLITNNMHAYKHTQLASGAQAAPA